MLRENDGWAAFVYTPRGNNHGKKLYDAVRKQPGKWFCELQTLYDTRAYDPDQTMEEERAAGRPEALIRQEYLCDWTAANVGAVFGDLVEAIEKDGRIGEFKHPTDGVYTTWDLGISDATAIWFWRINADRTTDVIDHYEATGKPLSHFFDEVERRGYKYERHWLPHDARARTFQTGVSTLEQVADRWGAQRVGITPELSLADGIQAGRWLLQQPVRFHSRTEPGVEALKAYHYVWDEDRKVLGSKPEHDWSSHTADAFRYLALVVKYTELITRKTPAVDEPMVRPPTLNDQWDALDRERSRGEGRI